MASTFLLLILRSMRYRSLRSWLTILGIIIGIMLVVIILALGNGIQNAVKSSLQMFGTDLVIIYPGKESNPLVGLVAGERFRVKDLMDLERLPGVKYVLAADQGSAVVEYQGEKQNMLLHVQDWEHYVEIVQTSQGARLLAGRWPQSDDVQEVVLGTKAMKTLFRKQIHINDMITVKSKLFRVVGETSVLGESSHDNAVFMSLKQFNLLTGSRGTAFTAVIKLKPGYDVALLAQQIRFQLSKQSVVRDFSVLTPDKANQIIGNVLSIIELVLMIIALVSLAVGGVGVMNTMYTSVLERTKQIGIMKAIGASNETILTLFLIESGFIGVVGGLLGIVFGILSAYGIGAIAAQQGAPGMFSWASIDYLGLFALLVFTFIVGVIAGVFPARTASRLEPAEALRYE